MSTTNSYRAAIRTYPYCFYAARELVKWDKEYIKSTGFPAPNSGKLAGAWKKFRDDFFLS